MIEDAKYLSKIEKSALAEIKRRISALFSVTQYVLFGSKARGAAPDSDVDLLIVTERELSHRERHRISHEIFEVNLALDTQFSFIAIDSDTWNSEIYEYMPLHINVEKEGIAV
jgi:predicted nucleotidyltransferase